MKMTFKTVVFGGFFVFIAVVTAAVFVPGLIYHPDRTLKAVDYTNLEQKGRELFYSNGCNYCHTQYVREQDTALGAVSEGGDFYFDNPLILGSERTGPDLSNIGRKRSEMWEFEHHKNPRDLSPLSIMPSFEFLPDADLMAMSSYLFSLGDRVAQERMILPPASYAGGTDPFVFPEVQGPADQGEVWATWDAAGLQQGKELYVKYCLTCHGCAGNGLGSYGGTTSVTPANFKVEPYRSMPPDQWFWHVSEGVPGTVMPVWKESLTEAQRWTVIRYIREIFAQPTMHATEPGSPTGAYVGLTNPITSTVQVLDEGKTIFTRECMVCHGDAGKGHGPYRDELQPAPPDFSDAAVFSSFTDADYFWRISEGMPWTAMPAWKIHYDETSRWKVVHYLRAIFTQTEALPPAQQAGLTFTYPDFYRDSQRFPADVSFDRGRIVYLQQCAHCHGYAGAGNGPDGQYLNPGPTDLVSISDQEITPESEGKYLAMLTFGIQNSAMPAWGEWLPVEQRWDVIKFLFDAFSTGRPQTTSVDTGNIAVNYQMASSQAYIDQGHTISVTHGAELYTTFCAPCHGDRGQGNGPGTAGSLSGGPAAFPAQMREAYVLWRVQEGVPDGLMYPFKWIFTSDDAWDVTAYLTQK